MSKTMNKRKTVIGSPYWYVPSTALGAWAPCRVLTAATHVHPRMAPEVISAEDTDTSYNERVSGAHGGYTVVRVRSSS
jgi:hypothetical protein